MSHPPRPHPGPPSGTLLSPWTKRLICVIAAIGFAFDTYELLVLPLITRPALMELGGLRPGSSEFATWASLLFYVPALAGGAFGLLGGYLTDRLGRRRVLTWSIAGYACAAFVSGFSTSLGMLLACRTLVFVFVSVEFVAAIAWLAETFPDPRERERVLGFTQVFGSTGALMVSVVGVVCAAWSMNQPVPLFFGLQLPAVPLPDIAWPFPGSPFGSIANPRADWRYLSISGLLPAIPLALLRPFLPESPAWTRARRAGTLKRPRLSALFEPALRRTTMVTTLLVMCSYGVAMGALQQMPQIVPGLPEVRADVASAVSLRLPPARQATMTAELVAGGRTEADAAARVAGEVRRIASAIEQERASRMTGFQAAGSLLGRIALAVVVLIVVGRQRQYRLFVVPGLLILPWAFGWAGVTSFTQFQWATAMAGFLSVGQLSFWGNYLPTAYPLHLRGTGESFAANIGGRMCGTLFAALTQWMAYALPGQAAHTTKLAYVAAGVGFGVFAISVVASYWLPEPEVGSGPV